MPIERCDKSTLLRLKDKKCTHTHTLALMYVWSTLPAIASGMWAQRYSYSIGGMPHPLHVYSKRNDTNSGSSATFNTIFIHFGAHSCHIAGSTPWQHVAHSACHILMLSSVPIITSLSLSTTHKSVRQTPIRVDAARWVRRWKTKTTKKHCIWSKWLGNIDREIPWTTRRHTNTHTHT